MSESRGPDPNEGSTDPMVAEYWTLGEDLQDTIRSAGYESPQVDGIAVDVHDLLQSAEHIRDVIVPSALSAEPAGLAARLQELRTELAHLRWHVEAADEHLRFAIQAIAPANEQPL